MNNRNLKRWIIPNLPYILFVYLFDKAAQTVRLATNAIKSSATATFTQYRSDNETELNLVRTKNVTIGPNKRVRGYKGICVADSLSTDFITLPDDYPTPFDD